MSDARDPRPGPGRVAAGATLALAVLLLLHVGLLHGLLNAPEAQSPVTPGATGSAAAPLRALPLQLVAAISTAPPNGLRSADAPLQRADAAPPDPAQPVPAPRPTARAPAVAAAAAQAQRPAAGPAAEPATPVTAQPPDADVVPGYAVQLPDPALLRYALQRGEALGSASLSWRRLGQAYELSLDAELQGKPVLGSTSRSLVDADGLAPRRMVERRREKELRAVNFQREAGRTTFSGPQLELPLWRAAQDRLSLLLQLPGIVQADPALARDRGRLTLFVVGPRGDAEAWHFEVRGRDTLRQPDGTPAQALHLRREPTRPYDTRVELWLDPQRQDLPVRVRVRVRFTTVPDGQPTELRLVEALPAPG